MPRFTTLIRSKTLRVAGAVAAFAVTAPFATLSADAQKAGERYRGAAGCRYQADTGSGVWQKMPQPTFEGAVSIGGTGIPVPQTITSFAVSPTDAKRVAVTNGNSVYVSTNGGCSWGQGYQLDPVKATTKSVIRTVQIDANGRFYAAVEQIDSGVTVGTPSVVSSASGGGGTWTEADASDGLPPIGRPLTMRGSADGRVLYLSFSGAREENAADCPTTPIPSPIPCNEQNGERLGLLYASTDGGRTWSSRTDPQDLNGIASIKHYSVDPANANTLWAVANGTLYKSTDGGRTYTAPPDADQGGFQHTAVEALRPGPGDRGIEVVTFSASQDMLRLQDGKWILSKVPFGAVSSVAQSPDGDIAVTSAGGRGSDVWRIFPADFVDYDLGEGLAGRQLKQTQGWESINPTTALPDQPDVKAGDSHNALGTFYVRASRGLLRFMGSRLRNPIPPAAGVQIGEIDPPKGRISPNGDLVDIPVNGTKSVKYRLTLPPAPTPIDVYLIVDNSGSMQPFIDQLKEDLREVALRLNGHGIDIAMGIGQINVQPDTERLPVDDPRTPDVDESKPRPIYQNLRKVGKIDGPLFDALRQFDGNAGSGREPQLEALWQAVHGDGMADHPVLTYLNRYKVPKGHQAGFRDELGPIKVIVHATDEAFSTNLDGAHNDFDEVIKALNEKGVKQIGLSQGLPDAARDLRRVARGTDAVAPKGGTDCDADGKIGFGDLRQGEPLVCGVTSGLDTTLVNLIRSLKDRAVIGLQAKSSPVVTGVSHTAFNIDAKVGADETFTVTYSCKGLEAGRYEAEFTAALRGSQIATAVTPVRCGGVDGPAAPRPPALPLEPAGNPPPPQPQPIAPAPVPLNPVPQPQTQPQVQSQVNPQGGMADQEEQQLQLAAAQNDITEDSDQLAMVGLSYEDSPMMVLTLGMTLTAAAGGLALQRRSRTATARVTVRGR